MGNETQERRGLKKKVLELLNSDDFEGALGVLYRLNARKVVNPLFLFLCSGNEQTKWRAVTAMGSIVGRLADEDIESARVIIRRLMWNLNDESGGIAWGAPEAMGEILANNRNLAEEYSSILVSYAREDGNFQENELMQRGVLWGIGRLCQVRPELLQKSGRYIIPFLRSGDAAARGLAAWIMGYLRLEESLADLKKILKDQSEFLLYLDRRLVRKSAGQLAKEALRKIEQPPPAEEDTKA